MHADRQAVGIPRQRQRHGRLTGHIKRGRKRRQAGGSPGGRHGIIRGGDELSQPGRRLGHGRRQQQVKALLPPAGNPPGVGVQPFNSLNIAPRRPRPADFSRDCGC